MKSSHVLCARAAAQRIRDRNILSSFKTRYVAQAQTSLAPGPAGELAATDGHLHHRRPAQANEARIAAAREMLHLPLPSEASLRALFDLTGAEARLAQLLASGDSVEEVAHKLCIKMTTARSQLAAVFAKTETRRQAKLVAILSHIAHLEMSSPENDVPIAILDPRNNRLRADMLLPGG